MIQGHRDNTAIVQPLLKTILVLSSAQGQDGLETDSNDSAGDILSLLTTSISQAVASDPAKVTHLKVCLNVLSRINNLLPEAPQVTEVLVRDLFERIKAMIATENDLVAAVSSPEQLQIVAQTLTKYLSLIHI